MFGRSKSEPAPTSTPAGADADARPGAKGRPTPTRREAEAAAKARAKVPRTRKEQAAAARAARSESSAKVRQAMRTGDERYLPARDRGPVRRFIRDFVDSRFSFIEVMVPILVLTLVMSYSGSAYLAGVANTVLLGTFLLVTLDMVRLRFAVRKQLRERFPDAPTKGTTYYAVMRALQMKFMRLPKAQVKIGQRLPDTYR